MDDSKLPAVPKSTSQALEPAGRVLRQMLDMIASHGHNAANTADRVISVADLKKAGKDVLSEEMFGFISELALLESRLKQADLEISALVAENSKLKSYQNIVELIDTKLDSQIIRPPPFQPALSTIKAAAPKVTEKAAGSDEEVTEIKKLVIGQLLQRADPLTKSVLTAFNPTGTRSGNTQTLSSGKFQLESLEACALFLAIDLADLEGNKVYTKATLAARIVAGLFALFPSTCTACNEIYSVEFDAPMEPLFQCYRCFQGSHSCDPMIEKHQLLKDTGLTDGLTWLCKRCLGETAPVKQRKSKTKYTGGTVSKQATETHTPAAAHPSAPVQEDLQSAVNALATKKSHENEICEKYRLGKCPHGLRGHKEIDGEKCRKQHPNKCYRYIKFGKHSPKSKKGCKKGDSCKYFHPLLCKFSLRNGLCLNKDCTFPHLVGTKREKSPAKRDISANKKPKTKTNNAQNKASKRPDKAGVSQDFLGLKRMLEEAEARHTAEMKQLKSLLQPHYQGFPPFIPQLPRNPQVALPMYIPPYATPLSSS